MARSPDGEGCLSYRVWEVQEGLMPPQLRRMETFLSQGLGQHFEEEQSERVGVG